MGKIQNKLVRQILLTSTLPLIILSAITVSFLGKMAVSETHQRLKSSLNAGSTVYDDVCNNLKFTVRDQNRRIYTLMDENQLDLLKNEYAKIVKENRFDFFIITDNFGSVRVSIPNPSLEGQNIANYSYVRKALLKGQFSVSTEVLDAEELKQFGLFERSVIFGIPATRGMIIQSTFPVINNNEIIVGTVSAGYLLNNNNAIIIDPIMENTAFISSIFLDDIRICSSVPSQGDEYAIGSRLDPQKSVLILSHKKDYLGRIRVINEWYLAGYTPLYNSQRQVVGILGIGLPEALVYRLRNNLVKIFIIAVIFSLMLAFIIGSWIGGGIVKSVNKLMRGIEAVMKGDYEHQIRIESRDEVQEVGNFFNKMTSQLRSARKQLGETHKQLIQYEKMAAIGRMAAVLSHELRNVFAGIEVSIYYVKAKMTGDLTPLSNKIAEIEKEISYAHTLLNNISTFVTSRKVVCRETGINNILEDTLNNPLLQDMIGNNKVVVEKDLDPSVPAVMADWTQMKEVFSNLCLNAVQAMPNGGTLKISTRASGAMIEITVADTGSGISKENMQNLFTPFFTTKSKGLGLGLFIAREIVELHKGRIELSSEENKGSRIIVFLPVPK
ncbi:MAG: ATP-binding protein [Candidatus Omnitrophica bacterium]|nr:ATP-binding protein [Candidatus Omnitrophota bacterium]